MPSSGVALRPNPSFHSVSSQVENTNAQRTRRRQAKLQQRIPRRRPEKFPGGSGIFSLSFVTAQKDWRSHRPSGDSGFGAPLNPVGLVGSGSTQKMGPPHMSSNPSLLGHVATENVATAEEEPAAVISKAAAPKELCCC